MWTKINGKDQTKMERVFVQGNDLAASLKQTMIDIREENDQEMYKAWGLSPKELKWCEIKIRGVGDEGVSMEFHVNQLVGGYRTTWLAPQELDKRMLETEKVLKKFESVFRKRFKELTGKALKLSNQKTFVDREEVALNGLYRFFAIKEAQVKTELEGQNFEESPELE